MSLVLRRILTRSFWQPITNHVEIPAQPAHKYCIRQFELNPGALTANQVVHLSIVDKLVTVSRRWATGVEHCDGKVWDD